MHPYTRTRAYRYTQGHGLHGLLYVHIRTYTHTHGVPYACISVTTHAPEGKRVAIYPPVYDTVRPACVSTCSFVYSIAYPALLCSSDPPVISIHSHTHTRVYPLPAPASPPRWCSFIVASAPSLVCSSEVRNIASIISC